MNDATYKRDDAHDNEGDRADSIRGRRAWGGRGNVVFDLSCSAQTVARLKLTIPKEHPRIGITSADLDRVRGTVNKEPWVGLWKGVLAKSERVRRGQLDPKAAFGGVGGQGVRFTMTEGLECVALHALVGKDAAAAKALSDFFEAWDPAPLEKDIADTDFMSSGEFFEGLAVVLDWTWDLLTESARAKLRAIVEQRARHNYDGFVGKRSWEATIEANNHSMASMGASVLRPSRSGMKPRTHRYGPGWRTRR